MTKREASLRKRLHAAHTFIGSLAFEAKDYGSSFSSGVYYDCRKFLNENRPVKEPRMVLVEKNDRIDLIRAKLFAQRDTRIAEARLDVLGHWDVRITHGFYIKSRKKFTQITMLDQHGNDDDSSEVYEFEGDDLGQAIDKLKASAADDFCARIQPKKGAQ